MDIVYFMRRFLCFGGLRNIGLICKEIHVIVFFRIILVGLGKRICRKKLVSKKINMLIPRFLFLCIHKANVNNIMIYSKRYMAWRIPTTIKEILYNIYGKFQISLSVWWTNKSLDYKMSKTYQLYLFIYTIKHTFQQQTPSTVSSISTARLNMAYTTRTKNI